MELYQLNIKMRCYIFTFLVYLLVWSFVVGAALSGACGLAAHAIFPFLSVQVWGIIQAIVALVLVIFFKHLLSYSPANSNGFDSMNKPDTSPLYVLSSPTINFLEDVLSLKSIFFISTQKVFGVNTVSK